MSKLKLSNVRLSFPSLFTKSVFDGKEGKFEGTFLIHKEEQAKLISKIEAAQLAFLVEKFGSESKIPKSLKYTCFMDGDTKDYAGYENQMALKAGNNTRPTVIGRDKAPVTEDDNIIYAGCYVNAIVDFWFSDHPKGGKQLLANLLGVQFSKDGESFGAGGGQDCSSDFDELEEIEEDEF